MRIQKIFTVITTLLIMSSACYAQKGYRLRSVSFKGNEILADDLLQGQLNTRPKKTFEKIFFWKKNPEFIESVLKDDITRLTGFYNRNGFLNPVISYNTDTAGMRRLINVDIHVSEGSFVNVNSVKISIAGDTSTSYLADSLKAVIPLKEGERFIDENVFSSQSIIQKSFSDHGYPFTRVVHGIKLNEEHTLSDVKFSVETGPESYFGDVVLSGDSLVPEKFIEKYLLFSEGEKYSQKKIDKTQQELFGTDLFQYVVITSKKDSVQGNRIPVNVMLRELPRWSLETGIGYGTEDKLRLAVQVKRLNFLGGARRLIVNAKTSYFLPFSFDIRFVQPDFLFRRLDLILNPFYFREREISYRIDRAGGSLNFVYRLGKNLSSTFSYSFENDNIIEVFDLQLDPSELKHNKSVFSFGGQLNSSDDPFFPSKGYKFDGTVSLAGLGLSNKVNYYKIDLSLVNYFSLADDVILATRIGTGVIQSLESSRNTPIEERFYLGGATSLRGWGRHRISPVNESGIAAGGNTMLEGSLELRFPIYDIFGGVVFIDAGNVWTPSYGYGPRLHYNIGPGFRVKTPIGPIRLDFATPVINDHFNFQFFISVGHAF